MSKMTVCKQCKKRRKDSTGFQEYKGHTYCSDCMFKCTHCGTEVDDNGINSFCYYGIFYCEKCFLEHVNPNDRDRHYTYLKFQKIVGRKPTNVEWTQCEKYIQELDWDWRKIEFMLEYVYEIEQKEINEEHGVIAILPYYEAKARKFFDMLEGVYSSIEEDIEDEVVTVYVRQLEKPKKPVQFKSIDDLIDWSEEEEWQE